MAGGGWRSPQGAALIAAVFLIVIAACTRLVLEQTSRPIAPECVMRAADMGAFVDIPGGGFVMGADPVYPEEGPPHRVYVSPFQIQIHEVTNAQFSAFVDETGYITEAERLAGSALYVETPTRQPGALFWWTLSEGASWRSPQGEGSVIDGLDHHPVVHVTLDDARAYSRWAGGRLPTEVEWEYAASLGLFDPNDPESGMRAPDGAPRANVWTGLFPIHDTGADGFAGTAPVGCFQANLVGVHDMIGNVWEWTESPVSPSAPRFTIKGGSYLCSENYCQRYRPAARDSLEADFSTGHVGFRVVRTANATN